MHVLQLVKYCQQVAAQSQRPDAQQEAALHSHAVRKHTGRQQEHSGLLPAALNVMLTNYAKHTCEHEDLLHAEVGHGLVPGREVGGPDVALAGRHAIYQHLPKCLCWSVEAAA